MGIFTFRYRNYRDTNLNFSGVPQFTKTYHKRLSSNVEVKTTEVFTYSPQSRLLTHTHQVNALPLQLLASNSYDELGQLISKNVGNTTATPLQKVDYAYNIRGWLTSINNDQTNNLVLNTTEKDLFAFKINYNITEGNVISVKSLYNGNISETYFRTGSDNVLRKYGYEYDNLNRLKNAIYQKPGGNTYPTYEDYSEKNINYDKNGNIQTLYRNGDLVDALPANQIDNLQYSYKPNSNILTSVNDNSGNTSGFQDGNINGDDYGYDVHGNMITDKNKNITAIVYNHLNLPTKVTFGSTGSITYIYNAIGQKVEKQLYTSSQGSIPVISYYCGEFQYIFRENYADYVTKLQFITTSEGYVKHTAGVYSYVFNYTDHLGNVRLSYGLNANVLTIFEENNYYPFGLKHKGYNSNNLQANYKYKFNGKELQDELGLNLYDYGARNYDPALGRWMNIDPKAEKYFQYSPYVYVANNPLIYVDPDGKDLILAGDKKNVDRTIAVANKGIGMNIVKTDKNGNVTMKSLSDKQFSKLSSEQKGMYGVMKDVIGKKGEVVKIGVESGSKDVLIGSYKSEKIDIADIEAFGTGKAVNAASTLGHELKEQKEKQLNGEGYGDSHADGMTAEKSITGYERQSAMASSTSITQNADGSISGNADVNYTKGSETVKASIIIENSNVKEVKRN